MVKNMTYVRCVYIRDLLSITVEEAAAHIGEVSIREWINWESNRITAPDYVIKRIAELARKHDNMEWALAKSADQSEYKLPDYQSYQDYLADHPGATYMDWKIAQQISFLATKDTHKPHQTQ